MGKRICANLRNLRSVLSVLARPCQADKRLLMRVLLFGPYPASGQPVTGGVMAVVQALAHGLARHPDLEVAVAAAHVDAVESEETDAGVRIFRLTVPRYPRTRFHKRLRRSLLEIADRYQPDLIHAHGSGYYAAAALDSGRPQVITLHGVVRAEAQNSGARNLKEWLAWQYDAQFERSVLLRAGHVIAISPYVRNAFGAYDHIHWHDINNPVDDVWFTTERHPEPGRLLSPSRVIPRKGTDVLIEAFAAIAADHPEAELRLAGETESMPDFVRGCRRQVASAGLDTRVHFLGNLGRSQLQDELARCQVVVLPARQETAPMAVAEALAAGCPVIATRVGGMPDMITSEKTGMLVPPGDANALAASLRQILSDPGQSNAMGERARESADRYRLDSVVDRTLEVYDQVLAETRTTV
ncbi:MAG: glycosyltransferase family 4 protein [Caldilineales bacterium]|nr:glycosyltransferase family 4 protein [Caldilineales bacterium]